MTSPCIRARQELSKKLDRLGNTYKLSKCYFTWLKSKETNNSIWKKNKGDLDNSDFSLIILKYSFTGK